jgi:hypothetical protein
VSRCGTPDSRFQTLLIDAIRPSIKHGPIKPSDAKSIASAEAEPAAHYLGDGAHIAFEFRWTVSRLAEMRFKDDLALPHGRLSSKRTGNKSGLVEN